MPYYDTNCEPCGKRGYRSRSCAKAMAKTVPGNHMTAHRCPVVVGLWHLGHLPRGVVHGHNAKAKYEASVERRRAAS